MQGAALWVEMNIEDMKYELLRLGVFTKSWKVERWQMCEEQNIPDCGGRGLVLDGRGQVGGC